MHLQAGNVYIAIKVSINLYFYSRKVFSHSITFFGSRTYRATFSIGIRFIPSHNGLWHPNHREIGNKCLFRSFNEIKHNSLFAWNAHKKHNKSYFTNIKLYAIFHATLAILIYFSQLPVFIHIHYILILVLHIHLYALYFESNYIV